MSGRPPDEVLICRRCGGEVRIVEAGRLILKLEHVDKAANHPIRLRQ